MMRIFAVLAVLLLGACSAFMPASVDATRFRNAQDQVAEGCGPLQGFARPLQKAQQGCIDAWKSKGWTPASG
jgi:hypothetical protein